MYHIDVYLLHCSFAVFSLWVTSWWEKGREDYLQSIVKLGLKVWKKAPLHIHLLSFLFLLGDYANTLFHSGFSEFQRVNRTCGGFLWALCPGLCTEQYLSRGAASMALSPLPLPPPLLLTPLHNTGFQLFFPSPTSVGKTPPTVLSPFFVPYYADFPFWWPSHFLARNILFPMD